jgi:hypothetical protein
MLERREQVERSGVPKTASQDKSGRMPERRGQRTGSARDSGELEERGCGEMGAMETQPGEK